MASSEGSELEQLDDFLEQAEEEIVDEEKTMAMTPRSSSTMAMGTVEMATMIWCHHHHHRFLRHQSLGEMDRGHHRGLRLQVDHNMEVHKVKVLNVVDPERDWP
jgi:hypothetical protein